MAVNLKIKNASRVEINPTNVESAVRINYRFIDLKMDLNLLKVGNPYYFNQKMVNGTDIDIAKDEEAIKAYLINLFSCSPGDLYLNPTFGINLKSFVFEQITENTARILGETIYNSVLDITDGIFATSSDRNNNVKIDKVFITPNVTEGAYEIEITFYIKPLNKNINIFGTISPVNGVYFYSK